MFIDYGWQPRSYSVSSRCRYFLQNMVWNVSSMDKVRRQLSQLKDAYFIFRATLYREGDLLDYGLQFEDPQ